MTHTEQRQGRSPRGRRGPAALPLALGAAALLAAACHGGHADGPGWNPLKAEVPQFKQGLKAYADSRYADAEKKFDEANREKPSPEGEFDEGSALYKQKKLSDALDDYRNVLGTQNDDLKERAWFDMGNSEAASQNLEEAVTDYRRALEIRPYDVDARYNLEWAQRTIDQKKQQQSKNGKQNDKDKSKDDKNQQAKNDKDKQGQQKQDQNGQQQKNEQARNDQGKQGQQNQQQAQQQQAQQQQAQQQQAQQQQAQQQQGKQGDEKGELAREGDKGNDRPMTHQETAAILDALQADEHPLEMWKFEAHKNHPRSPLDKDW